jgi:hypothetical protein
MPWVEVFAVFVVSHLVGDFILQTEFQAINKHGGLGRDPVRRRALFSHAISYTATFTPALVWLAGADYRLITLVAVVLAIGVPHLVQDDGTAIKWWMRTVKHTEPVPGVLAIMVDQCFHMVALMLAAIVVGT